MNNQVFTCLLKLDVIQTFDIKYFFYDLLCMKCSLIAREDMRASVWKERRINGRSSLKRTRDCNTITS